MPLVSKIHFCIHFIISKLLSLRINFSVSPGIRRQLKRHIFTEYPLTSSDSNIETDPKVNMVSSIFNVTLRGVQALFGIIVLGLSVTLIRGHHWGNLPAGLGYGALVGGLSFVAAFIGLAATWFDFLGGMVGLVIDGVVALVNLAGGVVSIASLDQHHRSFLQICKNKVLTFPKAVCY